MTADQNRSEVRIRSRGSVTILAAGFDQISGTIFDVSTSGLGVDLEMNRGLDLGTSVVIDGPGFAAEGVVRYCECAGTKYRVGIHLKPAVSE